MTTKRRESSQAHKHSQRKIEIVRKKRTKRKKKQEKQRRSHKHQTTQQEKKEELATCHDASGERLREPKLRSIKKGMTTDDLQTSIMGFRPARKKGKRGELPNGGIKKGMVSAYPKMGSRPWTFKGTKTKGRKG